MRGFVYIFAGVCIIIATCNIVSGFDHEMRNSDASMYPYALQSMKTLEKWHGIIQHGLTLRTIKECYDMIGCFWSNGTFKYIWSIPSSPDVVDTKLLLYTRDNPTEPQMLDYRNVTTLRESNLQQNRPIKIICHGFGGSSKLIWVGEMKDAFLEKEDVHVIVVDWSKGAAIPNYLWAVPNTELVGRQIAVLLNQIRIHYGIGWDKMHMIGFSMGAQVGGFVGKSTQTMFNGKIARLTALDAAAPLFQGYGPSVHVDPSDATFVDSIHTNADSTIKAGCGMKDPIGHVDFYPNGGIHQPGCSHYTIIGFFKDLFTGNKEKECHHMRAVRLYIESIKKEKCSFVSFPCSSYDEYKQNQCFLCIDGKCGKMGYDVKGLGTYYTTTAGEAPYCSLPLLLTVVSSNDQEKTFGQLQITLYAKNGQKEMYNLTEERGNLIPGGVSISHVSASPNIESLQRLEIIYKPFSGYFRNGNSQWKISHVVVMKPTGPLFTACNKEVQLDSHVPQVIISSKNKCWAEK